MTKSQAIEILYSEATSEERTYSLKEINEAKKTLELDNQIKKYLEQMSKENLAETIICNYSIDGSLHITMFRNTDVIKDYDVGKA